MQLVKTEKGRSELQAGKRTLGQRERTMLILADGKNTVQTVSQMFNGEAMEIALQLVQTGYLVAPGGAAPANSPGIAAPAPANSSALPPTPAPSLPEAAPSSPASTSDSFEGKRSLATTRMFLFDICERMFVRRDPAQAETFREALRNAKDRETMLAAARDMIAAVEAIAGHERADSIAERIAMLLPPEA